MFCMVGLQLAAGLDVLFFFCHIFESCSVGGDCFCDPGKSFHSGGLRPRAFWGSRWRFFV